MRRKRIQYTIRHVPPDVDAALRQRAQAERKTLQQTLLDAIRRSLGLAEPTPVYHDLDRCIGTWVEDPDFDAAITEFDRIDPQAWR